jgi:hypothetical protein
MAARQLKAVYMPSNAVAQKHNFTVFFVLTADELTQRWQGVLPQHCGAVILPKAADGNNSVRRFAALSAGQSLAIQRNSQRGVLQNCSVTPKIL